jgi:hypothetical protein
VGVGRFLAERIVQGRVVVQRRLVRGNAMAGMGPIKIDAKIIRGSPVHVLDRVLTPIARLITAHRQRGTIRAASVEGRSWGVSFVQPLAVVEERGGREHVLLIPDRTKTVLRQMAIVAVVIPVVAIALIAANRLARSH